MERVKIGWAMRDISTDKPVAIPGQMFVRVSEGIFDPIYVTALAVDGGEGQDAFVFVSLDLTNLRSTVVKDTVSRAVEREPELPRDGIILNCTHTHTSVDTYGTQDKAPDGAPRFPGTEYREIVVEKAVEAILEAWHNRKPGGIAFGYGYAVAGHSRRVCYFEDMSKANPNAVAPNGTAIMYGNTRDPRFSHYEAGADHFLNCLFTLDEKDALTGMILNVPCPSQVGEQLFKLSADYWTEVREMVEETFGKGIFVLPQCAAAGDLSPRILHYKGAQERRMRLKYGLSYRTSVTDPRGEDYFNRIMTERRDIAERIVKGAAEVWSWAKKDIRREVRVRRRSEKISLALRKITPEEAQWCRDTVAAMEKAIPSDKEGTPDEIRRAVSRYHTIKNRNTGAIERFEKQGDDPRNTYTLNVAALDEVAFCFNCFELYMDFMHRIQARSPFLQTFV